MTAEEVKEGRATNEDRLREGEKNDRNSEDKGRERTEEDGARHMEEIKGKRMDRRTGKGNMNKVNL